MCAKSLKSFARKQAEDEKKETSVPAAESTADESTTDETDSNETETDETESTGGESTDETVTTDETDKKSAIILKADQVAINASELKKLKADAAEWNKNKGQFATLTDWHKSMQDAGANIPGKEDTSTQHDKTGSSVSDQPWNKKASEAYGKGAKNA